MSSIDILVPDLPESITNATVLAWHKNTGDIVQRDEVLVEIETDKVIFEVSAPETGILETLLKDKGTIVIAHQVLGRIRLNNDINDNITELSNSQECLLKNNQSIDLKNVSNNTINKNIRRCFIAQQNNLENVKNSDINKNSTDEDTDKHIMINHNDINALSNRKEKRVPMTNLRKCIAERLVKSRNSTATLTTFNEVNMQTLITLRKHYGDIFEKRHGIRLGFMSFYIKAVLEALRRFPELNAFIDGEDIVYHDYFDINIAISTPRGLVTPVIKNIDQLSIADIEKKIKELAIKGRDNKLQLDELIGGNFTITNSGVFGSLMSTPIVNPPQSAILGIHNIKDRPMAINGEVVILPMMYLALSYDHRLIDGKESVSFLLTVKDILEDPNRLLLDI